MFYVCFSSKQVYLDLSKILGIIYGKNSPYTQPCGIWFGERTEGYIRQ